VSEDALVDEEGNPLDAADTPAPSPPAPNNALLGYLSMRHEPARRVGWIQDFVIDRPYRRMGIGTRLLKVARRWAYEHAITRLMLETQTRNFPSMSFCLSSGFAFCGYNDRYFENQDIAVFFGQTLR
jgi:GNAT superfamily N-acetyltransferase